MTNNIKTISTILFFGALWGILEATIGHVLHFLPATIAGSIMFPIAGAILYKAYRRLNNRPALIYVGLVAALIKSVNFLMPSLSIYKTINPMIAIIMETALVVIVITMLASDRIQNQAGAAVIASIGWRVLFVSWMGLQYVLTGNLAPYLANATAILEFVVLSGLISSVFLIGLRFVVDRWNWNTDRIYQPAVSLVLFVVAAILTYIL